MFGPRKIWQPWFHQTNFLRNPPCLCFQDLFHLICLETKLFNFVTDSGALAAPAALCKDSYFHPAWVRIQKPLVTYDTES
jgi:hypothetical protein